MTLKLLFDQLKDIRKEVQIPLVLMGYLNPIMQYGFKDFCRTCRETGIDGVIIPDLPFKDYMEEYRSIAEEQDVRIIMLITPETSEERIRLIDEHTDGFIYMVSSAAITGAQKDFNAQKQAYFQRIADMNLRNPRMIGFGISNKQTFETASAHAAGAIIGSKFVTLLDEEDGDTEKAADKLLEALKTNLSQLVTSSSSKIHLKDHGDTSENIISYRYKIIYLAAVRSIILYLIFLLLPSTASGRSSYHL